MSPQCESTKPSSLPSHRKYLPTYYLPTYLLASHGDDLLLVQAARCRPQAARSVSLPGEGGGFWDLGSFGKESRSEAQKPNPGPYNTPNKMCQNHRLPVSPGPAAPAESRSRWARRAGRSQSSARRFSGSPGGVFRPRNRELRGFRVWELVLVIWFGVLRRRVLRFQALDRLTSCPEDSCVGSWRDLLDRQVLVACKSGGDPKPKTLNPEL